MKMWIQRTVRKYGYEIRKAPSNYQSIPIFDLAVRYLIAMRGEALTFVQVGAHDGKDDALRPYILKHPWKGVLIEPQPDVFARLKANYAEVNSRISFENVAISNSAAPLQLYRLPARIAPSDSIVSFDRKVIAKQSGIKPHEMEAIAVPTARLDDILHKYQLDPDLLQLDTEGYEWNVLQTIDLTQSRPRLIRFEHGHMTPQVIGTMTQHLNRYGYLVYYGGYEGDSVALRNDVLPM
jgi:FkbM family methyltransferase